MVYRRVAYLRTVAIGGLPGTRTGTGRLPSRTVPGRAIGLRVAAHHHPCHRFGAAVGFVVTLRFDDGRIYPIFASLVGRSFLTQFLLPVN